MKYSPFKFVTPVAWVEVPKMQQVCLEAKLMKMETKAERLCNWSYVLLSSNLWRALLYLDSSCSNQRCHIIPRPSNSTRYCCTMCHFSWDMFTMGLLEDDNKWRQCLQEADDMATGRQLWNLFATLLHDCGLSDPLSLWMDFHDKICDIDFRHKTSVRTWLQRIPMILVFFSWKKFSRGQINLYVTGQYSLYHSKTGNMQWEID